MKHDAYAALRFPTYRWFLSVHTSMILGFQMQITAVSWLIYERTGSAAMLGLSGLLQFLPVLVLSIPVGQLVDRRSRRSMLQAGLVIHFAASAMLVAAAMQEQGTTLLFTALVLVGIGNAFVSIARPSMLRDTVPEHAVENASNWNSIGRRLATIAGPAIAGVLIAVSGGAAASFILNNVCIAAAILGSLRIPASVPREEKSVLSWTSVLEGIRFIRSSRLVLSATLLDMFAVLLGGAEILLPVYTKDILHVGPVWLGLLNASPSVGALLTTIVLAHRRPFARAGASLLVSVALFGAAVVGFGVATSAVLAFLALALSGAFDAVSVIVRSTILQLYVPERVRGRVFAVNMIFIYSSNELGDFESGIAAALLGTVPSVVIGGIGAIVVAGLFALQFPELRRLGKLSAAA